jgi:hypothetical protein
MVIQVLITLTIILLELEVRANAFAGTSQSDGWAGVCTSDGITASVYSAGVIDILDYANTNKYKTMRILDGTDANGSGEAFLCHHFG